MRNALSLRLFAVALLALVVFGARTEPIQAQQQLRIIAAGFVDIDGGSDPNCPGCDGVYSEADQTAAASNPLPQMEFVVRNAAGTELGRLTTTDFLGVQRAEFSVPEEEEYFLELVSDPANWQFCPNEARERRITRADFRLTQVTETFHFTQGCEIGETPTPPPTAVPTEPGGPTPVPTEPPAEPPEDDGEDEDDGDDAPAQTLGQIRGVAFIDQNQDGHIGPGEPGLNDVKVNLGGGGLEVSQITPADGTFNFPGLGAGEFDVFIDPGPEWRVTTPKKYTVSVSGNDVAGIDFGLVRVGEAPAGDAPAVSAPRTARRLLIPAPGAGITLPATGIMDMPKAPFLGLMALALGAMAAVGVAMDRRKRR